MKVWGDGNKLIISEDVMNEEGQTYELYSIDLDTKQINYLLPSYKKYHLANEEEYQREYFKKPRLSAIGIQAFIDVSEDYVYFVWEGKLKIIKIDLRTGKQISVFGHKTNYYVEPPVPKKTPRQLTRAEKARMSFVKDVFATPQHVFVVYEGPNRGNFRIQMYTSEGKFSGDIPFPGSTYQNMWFEKESYTLYSLLKDKKESRVLVYKIYE